MTKMKETAVSDGLQSSLKSKGRLKPKQAAFFPKD